jgi:hypothetical protein
LQEEGVQEGHMVTKGWVICCLHKGVGFDLDTPSVGYTRDGEDLGDCVG